ncbi:MAG TPA: hypothetical protein VGT44_02310 [Ktedonobacteraceae bacterium]|nr:hypothetical protein [Ktedonobacteraceae bacterium]
MKSIKAYALVIALLLILAGCSTDNTGPQTTPQATIAPVNGFGIAANHVHSLLALSSQTLLLATHYGIYRSLDGGATWQQETSGPGQLMAGLMEYAMTVSPLDPQRLFVLTQPAVPGYQGTPGLYTSADGGKTWKLSIASSSISSNYIFTEAAGNDSPDEVYIYLTSLGNLGLKRSLDDGQHFSGAGALPFDLIYGMAIVPGAPGYLFVYSSEGIASTSDGGIHWHVIAGINGGIEDMVIAGANLPIYASGDQGIYASTDGGKTFKLVYTQASYSSLAVSAQQPQTIYGKTGSNIYRSTDGGKTWTTLPHIGGNLAVLAVVPGHPSEVYLSLSYPTAMYQLNASGTAWTSLTPPA